MTQTHTQSASSSHREWLAYVAPMALFMLMTGLLEANFPKYYVWAYIAKVVLVTGALLILRRGWKQDVQIEGRAVLPGVVVGLLVFWLWITLDKHTPPLAFLGKRTEFNPFVAIPDPTQRTLFLGFRFFGLAAMVPLMEELFWRSFLLRFITREDFRSVPMGDFSPMAFVAVAGAFALAHPEWLAAIVCAVAYGLLLRTTRSLFACILAHAVTNLALGLYVMQTQNWKFW